MENISQVEMTNTYWKLLSQGRQKNQRVWEMSRFIVENSMKTWTEKLLNVLTALGSSSGGLFQHQIKNKVRILNYWQLQPTEL